VVFKFLPGTCLIGRAVPGFGHLTMSNSIKKCTTCLFTYHAWKVGH